MHPVLTRESVSSNLTALIKVIAMLDEGKKRGVKLTVIDHADYKDYREIVDAIVALGYDAVVVDNGNTVFEKK